MQDLPGEAAAQPLPPLRQELSLHPGPDAVDGSPTWMLHDPAANRFYQLGWPAFEMLSRWHLGESSRLIAAVKAETTLEIDSADIEALLKLLSSHHLLVSASAENTARLQQVNAAAKPGAFKWLLHHYLFFRVPLYRPEPLLKKLAPHVRFAWDSRFWWLVAGVALLGLYLVSRRWEEFTHTFSAYGGWKGLIGIGIALSFAKVLHEFGHALAANRHGCRVPAMGVAFLVLLPMLYTDTNEAWKLRARRERLQIGAAGMLAELALAAFATLLWNFLPEGPFRAGVFFLATTTWIATLAINASPFMRFDGYFLLSDWLELPNLHARAFAQGRWWLRETLFGLDDAPPEYFPPRRRRFLIAFALATWLYRLTLFLSIALLVYHLFFKVLGIVLLIVELAWFIAIPVWSEVKVWLERRGDMHWNRQTRRSTGLLLALLAFVVLPWQTTVHAPALVMAEQAQGLYSPEAARLVTLTVADGQTVKAGDILATLLAPELEADIRKAEVDAERLRWQVEQQPFDDDLMALGPALTKRWQMAEATVQGLRAQQALLTVKAPFDGTVTGLNPDMSTGSWLASGDKLMQVTGPRHVKAEAFVTEAELPRIRQGETARLIPDRPEAGSLRCHIQEIDRVNVSSLDNLYLASSFGGPIETQRDRQRGMVPLQALFRVRLGNCSGMDHTRQELPGTAILRGDSTSLAGRALRQAARIWQREAGL